MKIKKARLINSFGYFGLTLTSITPLVALLIPVTGGYTQILRATASAKHTMKESVDCGDQSIRPFCINVSQDELTDLKRRLAATRWPEIAAHDELRQHS
jgi:hypothetical protein